MEILLIMWHEVNLSFKALPLHIKNNDVKILVFVNSKIGVIFGGHLGYGGHIEKLRDGSIAYFIQ